MQMIEQYAYQVGAGSQSQASGNVVMSGAAAMSARTPNRSSLAMWQSAKDEYDARPERGRAFCTLNRDEQVSIVRKYVNR